MKYYYLTRWKNFHKNKFFVLAVALTMALSVAASAFSFVNAAASSVIYDSIPDPTAQSDPSIGFQATQTAEFGDYIAFAGTDRTVTSVDVLLNSWACQEGGWDTNDCANPNSSSTGYTHPITLTLYNVDTSGPNPAIGSVIASVTPDISVPWRPATDTTTCTNGGYLPDCNNGYNFVATFDLPNVNVPDEIVYGVSFNTQTWGYTPIGVTGPYNSLNMSVPDTTPSVGTDVDSDMVFWNTNNAGYYTDGGSDGSGIFRYDTAWSGYVPAARFHVDNTVSIPTHLSPADGSYRTTATQTLIDWTDVPDPSDPVTYMYQSSHSPALNPDGSFASPVYSSGVLTASQIATPGTPEGVYYWHVKAIDGVGNESDWSDAWMVTVDNTAPATPTGLRRLLASDHSVVYECGDYSTIQSFHPDWADNTESDFSHYEYTSFNAGGAIGLNEQVFTDSIFEYNGPWLPGEGTYGFAVRAVDKAGNKSDWALSSKTLEGSCQITYDNTAPDVYFTSPADGTVVNGIVSIYGMIADDNLDTYGIRINGGEGIVHLTGTDAFIGWDTSGFADGPVAFELYGTDLAGNTTSDFMTLIVNNHPDRIQDCKHGGWEDFAYPSFRNQGQCVAYVLRHNHNWPRLWVYNVFRHKDIHVTTHHKDHHISVWNNHHDWSDLSVSNTNNHKKLAVHH